MDAVLVTPSSTSAWRPRYSTHAAAQVILVALVAATAWAYEERPATADVARSTERAADAHVE